MDQSNQNLIDFYQDKEGRYVITRKGTPVAYCKVERDAFYLKKVITDLSDEITLLNKIIEGNKEVFNDLEKQIRELNNKIIQYEKDKSC